MAIVNFNKWNSVPQQVDENRKAIETLAEYLEAHSATGLGIKSLTQELVSSDESGNTYKLTFVIGNQYTTPEEDEQNTYSFTYLAAKGAIGATGAAATIKVGTTTTGAAGTQAAVTNTGTSSAAVFDFTIPKGADGQNGTNGLDALMSHGVCESSSGPARMQSYFMSINLMNRTPVVGDGFVTMFENTTTQTPYLVVGEVTEVNSPSAPNTFKFTLLEAYEARGPQGAQGAQGEPGADGSDALTYTAIYTDASWNSTKTLPLSNFNRTPTSGELFQFIYNVNNGQYVYLQQAQVVSIASPNVTCSLLDFVDIKGAAGAQKYMHNILVANFDSGEAEGVRASFVIINEQASAYTSSNDIVNYLKNTSPVVTSPEFIIASGAYMSGSSQSPLYGVRVDSTLSYLEFLYAQSGGGTSVYNQTTGATNFHDTVIAL